MSPRNPKAVTKTMALNSELLLLAVPVALGPLPTRPLGGCVTCRFSLRWRKHEGLKNDDTARPLPPTRSISPRPTQPSPHRTGGHTRTAHPGHTPFPLPSAHPAMRGGCHPSPLPSPLYPLLIPNIQRIALLNQTRLPAWLQVHDQIQAQLLRIGQPPPSHPTDQALSSPLSTGVGN